MTRSLKTYVGRHQHPVVTHTSRVDWDEAAFTQGGAQPTSSRIIIRDEDGEYGPNKDNQQYVLGYHNVVRATEDASGSDVTVFRGRIEVVDTGRGPVPQKVDRYREHELTVSDYNRDLFGIDVVNFETRPGQNDKEQVQYLVSQYLSGSPRASTNLNGSNYVSSSNTQLIGSNVYSGVTPFDVLQDIADRAAKEFFVDVDGNLHYDGADSLAYLSSIRISDRVTDQSSNTYAPEWVSGAAKHHEGTDLVTSVRSYYGPDEDTTHNLTVTNTNDDKWDFWQVPFFDSLSQTEGAAERRATGELNYSGKPYVTATCRIGPIPAEWMGYIKGGQKIQVKARAMPGQEDSFEWLKIAELSWQYVSGDPTKAMATLVLERPRVRRRGAGGGSRPGATGGQPPPECTPGGSSEFPSESLSADWRTGNPTRIDPVTLISGYPWGHIGQDCVTAIPGGGCATRVDGTEKSQWFAVTSGGSVVVSFAAARIGSPGTGSATLQFDVGGSSFQNYSSGYCSSTSGYWSYESLTFSVPVGASYARFSVSTHSCIQYLFVGSPGGGGEECPPDSISPGSGGTSPYFARYDDPRFTAENQHITPTLRQTVVNNSGGTLDTGDVVIPDITYNGRGVTTTTTASSTAAMVGVVETGGINGADIVVIWSGAIYGFPVNDGAATSADGDYLYTSATAKAANVSATRTTGAVGRVIRDLSGNPDYVLWWGVPDGAGGSLTDHDHTAAGDGGDLTAALISNYLNFTDQSSAPSTPAAGKTILYSSNLQFYLKNSGGTVARIISADIANAKGDLFVATADNEATRLAVGANGRFLQADSTQTTGLKWATAGSTSISIGGSLGDVPPDSPGTYDEEFTGAADTLPTDWSWDTAPTNWYWNSRWPGMLWSEGSENAARTATRVNFAAAASFGLWWHGFAGAYSSTGDATSIRLNIADSDSSDWRGMDLRSVSSTQMQIRWLQKVGGGADTATGSITVAANVNDVYFGLVRGREGADKWEFYWSSNGITWSRVANNITHAFTIDRFLIVLKQTDHLSGCGVDWIRYRADNEFPRIA